MTNYKNVTLSENGLFKNNNTLLRFGVDELTIIHENINTTLKELTELTGLSKSTISRIKQGIKKGYFDDYINNNDTMDESIGTVNIAEEYIKKNNNRNVDESEGTVNIYDGVHITIYNNNPKTGNSVERAKKAHSLQLKQWSKKIRKRGAHICAKCGKKDKTHNQAHHIFPKSRYPALACDEGNGIVLCQKCHNEYHKRFEGKESCYNFIGWLNE